MIHLKGPYDKNVGYFTVVGLPVGHDRFAYVHFLVRKGLRFWGRQDEAAIKGFGLGAFMQVWW